MASTLLPYGLSTQLVDYLTRALKIEQVSNSLVQLHHLDHESFLSTLRFACKVENKECVVIDASLFVGYPNSQHKLIEDQILSIMPRSAVVVVTDVDVILSQLELIADNAQSRKHIDKYSLGFISALKTYFGDNKHRVLVPVKSVGAIPTSMSRSFVDMLDLGDIKPILNDTSDTPTFLTRKGAETYIKEKQRFNSLYAEVDQILDRSISLTHFQNRNKGKWLQLVSKNTLNCRLEEEQLDSCILLTSSMVRDAFQSQTFSRVKVAKSTMSSADKQVASVRWADIGGLERVREEVMNLIQLPIANPNLFPSGCHRRRGILFFGPPGNGKTLVAKAIATETQRSFISVKGPELLNMYVGESERNVRELFAAAKVCAPCILFFDELDSLVPKKSWSAGGASDRVVAQLVTEVDAVTEDVFLIGATNRPDIVDSSLLTPGRFDRKVYLRINKDLEAKVKIFSAQMRNFVVEDDIDIEQLCKTQLPAALTGADVYDITSRAYAIALGRKLIEVDALLTGASSSEILDNNTGVSFSERCRLVSKTLSSIPRSRLHVALRQTDLLEASRSFKPSVSEEELLTYESIAMRLGETN